MVPAGQPISIILLVVIRLSNLTNSDKSILLREYNCTIHTQAVFCCKFDVVIIISYLMLKTICLLYEIARNARNNIETLFTAESNFVSLNIIELHLIQAALSYLRQLLKIAYLRRYAEEFFSTNNHTNQISILKRDNYQIFYLVQVIL